MESRTPLRRVMEDEGRLQVWLARRVGKDPADISRIVNGLVPNDETKRAIAEALDRSVEELWPDQVTV